MDGANPRTAVDYDRASRRRRENYAFLASSLDRHNRFAPALASVALSFGPPEIFALMLLAFATFVGLGGDDLPKTILSICLGLVFAAVGFDEISGAPRLVFFDISGFLHGINFLVLAIGVYGIGEMLWTIEQTRGEIENTTPKMTARGMLSDTAEATRRGWKGTTIGSRWLA